MIRNYNTIIFICNIFSIYYYRIKKWFNLIKYFLKYNFKNITIINNRKKIFIILKSCIVKKYVNQRKERDKDLMLSNNIESRQKWKKYTPLYISLLFLYPQPDFWQCYPCCILRPALWAYVVPARWAMPRIQLARAF